MNIDVLQPKPFDLVGTPILIAGNAAGFEGHLSISVSEGHDVVTGSARVGSRAMAQFHASIDIPADAAFTLSRLFVTVADDSGGEEGAPIPTVTLSVLYGPMILDGYMGYWTHEVVRGDTLSKLSLRYYDDASMYPVIHAANQHIVSDPDLIFPGQILRIPRRF
jgi:nucleoid-associated protein YgaU